MPDEALLHRAEATRQRDLQRFKDAHNTSRATAEQLEKIFDLDLDDKDRASLLDWIEDPYALYPLESQTVFERALKVVQSEKKENGRMDDVRDEMREAEEREVEKWETEWLADLDDEKIEDEEHCEPTDFVRAWSRRSAVVQANFNEILVERGSDSPHTTRTETNSAAVDDGEWVFFWRTADSYGQLSQWYHSPFVADGMTFVTAEQYMMYKKAELFNDSEMMSAIVGSPSLHPSQHKKMGRSVKNFDAERWSNLDLAVVAGVNYYKFTQNETLKAVLMSTGNKTLVEASPYDRIWGIGFDSTNAAANVNLWGQNKLGRALMMVRDEIAKSIRGSSARPGPRI